MGITEQELPGLLKNHPPADWESRLSKERLLRLIDGDERIETIVVAVDIRKSTVVMKEAASFRKWAAIMTLFVNGASHAIRDAGGWFDKFTGDGFLAYWPVGPSVDRSTLLKVLATCHATHVFFAEKVLPDFRANSQNLPASGVGLSIGLDLGPAALVTVADDLTVVGPCVVGAVRMVSGSAPGETFVNIRLGEALFGIRDHLFADSGVVVTPATMATKEYAEQVAYRLDFTRRPEKAKETGKPKAGAAE